jgi:hypothetical protein
MQHWGQCLVHNKGCINISYCYSVILILFVFVFEMGSHYVAQAGLKLLILLPQTHYCVHHSTQLIFYNSFILLS